MEGIMEDSSIVKGKRTKRQRLQLSSAAAAAAVAAGPSTSASENTTEQEEDTAKWLILLAQGGQKPEPTVTEVTTVAVKSTSRRIIEAATTTSGKAGVFVYECKTCYKCFSSFQALGGHRASHKNPKLPLPPASADETKAAPAMNEDSIQLSMSSFPMQVAAKARIHECSICGAEFKSGQALGGHMRRHRPASNLHEPAAKKARNSNGLSLDLNLPPPSDDDADFANSSSSVSATKIPPFSFANKAPVLLLASSLLDCHY